MRINIDEIFGQMRGGQQTYGYDSIPIEKIDEFIEKVKTKHDMNLFMIMQDLAFKLEQGNVLSLEEVAIYPHILNRLQYRIQQGEQ